MSNNDLSIDEILKEAEEVLNRIGRTTKETIEQIKSVDEPLEPVDDVKTYNAGDKPVREYTPEKKKDDGGVPDGKTTVAPKISDKTTVAPKVSDKTAVVPSDKVIKKKFFKSNSKDVEYNNEPPKIIEKAATIKSKSRFDKTSDLQEIPTILAVEELEKTRIMLSRETAGAETGSENDYDSSAQIKLSGFDDEMDEVPEIDEEVAEELLKKRREEKVNKFRLFAPEELEENRKSEAKRILKGD